MNCINLVSDLSLAGLIKRPAVESQVQIDRSKFKSEMSKEQQEEVNPSEFDLVEESFKQFIRKVPIVHPDHKLLRALQHSSHRKREVRAEIVRSRNTDRSVRG